MRVDDPQGDNGAAGGALQGRDRLGWGKCKLEPTAKGERHNVPSCAKLWANSTRSSATSRCAHSHHSPCLSLSFSLSLSLFNAGPYLVVHLLAWLAASKRGKHDSRMGRPHACPRLWSAGPRHYFAGDPSGAWLPLPLRGLLTHQNVSVQFLSRFLRLCAPRSPLRGREERDGEMGEDRLGQSDIVFDIIPEATSKMENVEQQKRSVSESDVQPWPGAESTEEEQPGIIPVGDSTKHGARRVSMWNVTNLTISFANKLKKQARLQPTF